MNQPYQRIVSSTWSKQSCSKPPIISNDMIAIEYQRTPFIVLTHWGRVTHIWVVRRQAIIWTDAGILLIGPSWTNTSKIWIGIQIISFKKLHLKTSSAKWCIFCLGLNELIVLSNTGWCVVYNTTASWGCILGSPVKEPQYSYHNDFIYNLDLEELLKINPYAPSSCGSRHANSNASSARKMCIYFKLVTTTAIVYITSQYMNDLFCLFN